MTEKLVFDYDVRAHYHNEAGELRFINQKSKKAVKILGRQTQSSQNSALKRGCWNCKKIQFKNIILKGYTIEL